MFGLSRSGDENSSNDESKRFTLALAQAESGPFPPQVRAAAVHLACQEPGTPIPIRELSELADPPMPLEPPIPRPSPVGPVEEAAADPAPSGEPGNSASKPEETPPWLRWHDDLGLCLHLPFSRLSAAWIAWILAAVGLVESVSKRTVQRWLAADKIRPWRFRSWITPKDLPTFLKKATAVLDLYARVQAGLLEPHETVQSLDEKTSIQARRHDTYMPPKKGKPARVQHTYKRMGAVQLFAALDVATGRVFGQLHPNKPFVVFAQFLSDLILGLVASGKRKIHLILDNGSTHRPKHLEEWLKKWLQENQLTDVEVIVHWLPVRSSWLNQVEIFFSMLQLQALTPNNFASLADLSARILDYIALRNLQPTPIKWSYTSADLRKQFDKPPAPPPEPGPLALTTRKS